MIERIAALLEGLTLADLEAAAPVHRQRFAALCRHWADRADPPTADEPKAGILSDLKRGHRAE